MARNVGSPAETVGHRKHSTHATAAVEFPSTLKEFRSFSLTIALRNPQPRDEDGEVWEEQCFSFP